MYFTDCDCAPPPSAKTHPLSNFYKNIQNYNKILSFNYGPKKPHLKAPKTIHGTTWLEVVQYFKVPCTLWGWSHLGIEVTHETRSTHALEAFIVQVPKASQAHMTRRDFGWTKNYYQWFKMNWTTNKSI